jgi:hypothetical protein
MEIYLANADDLRRVWRPWEEPPACPAGPRNDSGGSCGTQRRSRDRGQPNRERQARPPGLNGAETGRGRRRQRERPSSLSGRPASAPMSAAGGRPFSQLYFAFNVCRSGAAVFTGVIFISSSPPPARQPPAGCGGGRCQGKEILNVKRLINVQHIRYCVKRLCSDASEKHQQA